MSYFTLIFWAEAIGYAFLIVIILNLAREHISRNRAREHDEHEGGLPL